MLSKKLFLDINELEIKCSEDENHLSEMLEEKEEFFSVVYRSFNHYKCSISWKGNLLHLLRFFLPFATKLTIYLYLNPFHSFLILLRFKKEPILFFFLFEESKERKRIESLPKKSLSPFLACLEGFWAFCNVRF